MDEIPVEDRHKDSQSFDAVANQYEEYRPEYPQELVESVIELTRLSGDAELLEIGSGTGKATRLFAQRGFAIHCIEPGRNLAAVAARNLRDFPLVTFEICRFEDWEIQTERFDLVFSAQAFHWVPKESGYEKAARALKPHGCLALFWNKATVFSSELNVELDGIYREIVPELDSQHGASEAIIQERLDDIEQSGWFGPVTLQRFPWAKHYRTNEYIGMINTYSDHQRLPTETRSHLLKAVSEAIDARGGSVELNYSTGLYVAPKRP